MLYGDGGDYVGDVPVIGPLSDGSYIPAMHLHDGPQGMSGLACNGSDLAFACAIATALESYYF